ncbi:MAG: redoxin domain-containing protein [Thermoanaerobaculia bacterium]
MTKLLQVGDEAPNFDLASTEDVVLMLRDEVPRTPVLLYLFAGTESAARRADLSALKAAFPRLTRRNVKVLGVSAATLDELKGVQRDLALPFPLLHDDRNLAGAYGADWAEGDGDSAICVLVGRDQRVLWLANPAPAAAEGVQAALGALPGESSTANYPRKVINRLVDRWVN